MLKITMVLAQAPWAPDGDVADKLEMRACLDQQAHLDAAAFAADPEHWTTRRDRPDHPARHGRLVRAGDGWALRNITSDDEPLWDVVGQAFRPGEVVLIRPPDGAELLFRVVAVEGATDGSVDSH